MPTFLSVAAENCPAKLRFPSLELNVTPDPVSNNKLPADEVCINSNSDPIGQLAVEFANIEHVILPPALKYSPALATLAVNGFALTVVIGLWRFVKFEPSPEKYADEAVLGNKTSPVESEADKA